MNVCVILDENLDTSDSEVYQPRFVWKTNIEVDSVRKHNYNCMLDDGIY